jgi:hypothetical protein
VLSERATAVADVASDGGHGVGGGGGLSPRPTPDL